MLTQNTRKGLARLEGNQEKEGEGEKKFLKRNERVEL
jgi:hypothetical protein